MESDFGLGHRVQIWVYHDNAENRILVVGSVQFISRAAEVLALNEYLLATLRILGGSVAPGELLRSRRQQFEAGEVAIQNGQIFNILGIELKRHISAVRLELRGLGGHFHRFAGGADLELGIHFYSRVSGHLNILELQVLKARARNLDAVSVWDQVRHRVVAAIVRSGLG